MIKLIIADDHKLVRNGLVSLLRDEQDMEVVAEATNGQEVLDLLTIKPADVVLMDIHMPVMDGFAATEQVKNNFSDTKVLALSMLDQEMYVKQILQAGASGFVMKSCSKEELLRAISSVAKGGNYICEDMSSKMATSVNIPDQLPQVLAYEESATLPENLSKCERIVLQLIAEGYTNAEMADKLFNSKRTIESHRQNLLLKTKCKNTAALVKYALKHNLLDM